MTLLRRIFRSGASALLAACMAGGQAPPHMYHYDGPEMQQLMNDLKAQHDYIPLQVGAIFRLKDRLLTITAVSKNKTRLLIEGTVRNLTRHRLLPGTIRFDLNESPDKQMQWFRAHPVTEEYHYGPGFNSHSPATSSIMWESLPGETLPFAAVWSATDPVAGESVSDLVVQPYFSPSN